MVRTLAVCSVLAFGVGALAADSDTNRSSAEGIVIEINGTTLTRSDVERKYPTALFQAKNTYFEAERKALEQLVDDYLLEQQAKREDVTVSQLLDKHVNNAIAKEPSEEALRVYFEGVDTNEPYEAVRGKIVEALRQRRLAKAKTAYIQSLRKASTISVRLSPPRADISVSNAPVRGAEAAPITLVEYADYECPYCQQIQPAVQRLEAEYKGKLLFAFKDMPLPMHANAQKAAEASRCAEQQGRYWQFHDQLFERKRLDSAGLKNLAQELGLDTAAFEKCLENSDKAEVVRKDGSEAQSLGIQGTPTFFVNGRYITGAASYEQLRAVVEEELAARTPRGTQQTAAR